jgi:hypothetical protein
MLWQECQTMLPRDEEAIWEQDADPGSDIVLDTVPMYIVISWTVINQMVSVA